MKIKHCLKFLWVYSYHLTRLKVKTLSWEHRNVKDSIIKSPFSTQDKNGFCKWYKLIYIRRLGPYHYFSNFNFIKSSLCVEYECKYKQNIGNLKFKRIFIIFIFILTNNNQIIDQIYYLHFKLILINRFLDFIHYNNLCNVKIKYFTNQKYIYVLIIYQFSKNDITLFPSLFQTDPNLMILRAS